MSLFCTFLCHFFTATTWNCLIRLFRENVNERGRNFILSLNLNIVHRNSTPGGFAYIWQSRWVGIIALKTERTQVYFWSDVFAAVASSDRKVTNIKMESGRQLKESGIPQRYGIQNPSFPDKDWNPVPGIQNPRLSWFPLPHGAISQKYTALRRIYNSHLSVWWNDEQCASRLIY